jgi:hypothetical protein
MSADLQWNEKPTTDVIVTATASLPLWKWTDEGLKEAWVSSFSRWQDDRWVLNESFSGQHKSGLLINWKIELDDDEYLTDARFVRLLDWLKRIVWSCFTTPARGDVTAPGTAGIISSGLRTLVPWLIANHRYQISDLTNQASLDFLDDLPELLSEDDAEDSSLTRAQIQTPVRMFQRIWEQAEILSIERADEPPFNGKSIEQITNELTSMKVGRIPPLPDEVAIPILNKATFFVDTVADDIIELLRRFQSARPGRGISIQAQVVARRQAVMGYEFSVPEGATEPWHSPIYDNGDIALTVKNLVQALRTACIIVIQSTTGMRISEICGIPFGQNPESDLPKCLEKRSTDEGLFDLYLLRARLSKTEQTPRTVEWIIGLNPAMSKQLPLAVRAIFTLQRIATILGVTANNPKNPTLLSGSGYGWGFARAKSSFVNPRTGTIRNQIKRFVETWVDLSKLPDESRYPVKPNDLKEWRESKGRIIKTHQFRKTFAQFAGAIDARLVTAVQEQYKHISLAMTYRYINNDQRAMVSTLQAEQNARMMYEMMRFDEPLAGRFGEQIEQKIPAEMKATVKSLPASDAWKKTIDWTTEHGFRLFFAPHGKCGAIDPKHGMRCHEVAGTTDWLPQEPNYETREPSLCAGCPSFVLDSQHKDFWQDRYINHKRALLIAAKDKRRIWTDADGEPHWLRTFVARADQARALLRKLNVDVAALDREIEESTNA